MTAIITAMKNEAETLLSEAQITLQKKELGREIYEGIFKGEKFVLIICGIGKVNAAAATQYIIDSYKPKRLMNFGLAGGIGNDIEIGDVFFVHKAVQYDFDLSLINNCEIGKLEEFDDKYLLATPEKNPSLKYKKLATGDRFNEDKNDEKLLVSYMKAELRDMEGGAIAQVAAMNNIPLYIIKAVSDKIENDSAKSYLEKSQFALSKLKEKLPDIFKEVTL